MRLKEMMYKSHLDLPIFLSRNSAIQSNMNESAVSSELKDPGGGKSTGVNSQDYNVNVKQRDQ